MKLQEEFIYVLTLDAILEAKKSLNREHDKEAIRQLEAIKKARQKLSETNQ